MRKLRAIQETCGFQRTQLVMLLVEAIEETSSLLIKAPGELMAAKREMDCRI